jgi:L-threonylcarbamoyladenylate synthase
MKRLKKAVEVVKEGGLIAYPTETVYGIGADIFNEDAVKRVFEIKGRDFKKPVSVAVSNYSMISEIAEVEDWSIVKRYLPGPYTLVMKKKNVVSDLLTAGSKFVGIRFPAHPVARALVDLAGMITSTSANLSGEGPPCRPEEIEVEVDFILDAGETQLKRPSKVIRISDFRVLRE